MTDQKIDDPLEAPAEAAAGGTGGSGRDRAARRDPRGGRGRAGAGVDRRGRGPAGARVERGSRGRTETPMPRPPPTDVPTPTAPTGPRTVGRLVADALRAAGVRYAFTVPGESFLGLLDALGDAGIRVVATRHEGGAAFMAEAHGQLTGRPAACIGTRAVGAANLAIGIHTARQDSSPMFAIVGQVPRGHRGHEAFQEIDQVATIGGLAKLGGRTRDRGRRAGRHDRCHAARARRTAGARAHLAVRGPPR